ncbi:hypothetical protein B0H15DRAFT_957073 [Mycena belliarum]|uniref:Uncharacterized protein n=1 Tax=Mycena belliarum TaxID=1033014 RepID=A0AAD6XH17_9AGAR|nr:hypothetical protein B0H15DRAFT_957073 [Mycena belliae]
MSIMYYYSSSSSVDMDRPRDDEEVDKVDDEMAVEANDIALSRLAGQSTFAAPTERDG